MRTAILALFIAAGVLAGCGGGGGSIVPKSGNGSGTLAQATLHIVIPEKTTNGKRRPAYVSPSTTQLAWTLDGVTQATVNLTSSNPNCTGSPLTCTVNFDVAPGTHTFSFYLEDSATPPNVLSDVTNYVYTLVAGQANNPTIVLGGVVSYFGIASTSNNFVTPVPSMQPIYYVYGPRAVSLTINAYDADNNVIVGNGAPLITATLLPSPVPPASLTTGSSNTWTLTSSYTSTSPFVQGYAQLQVAASPNPSVSPNPSAVTYAIQFFSPWVYVTSASGKVTAYDEFGNVQSPSPIATGLSSPAAIVYGQGISTPNASPSASPTAPPAYFYIADVTPVTPTPVPTPTGSNTPGPTTYTGSITPIIGNGSPVPNGTFSGSAFSGLGVPVGLAFDSNNSDLYVLNSSGTTLQAYSLLGSAMSLSSPTISSPTGIAFDTANDELYVSSSGGVSAYSEAGALITSFSGVSSASGIAYDSNLSELIVLSGATASFYSASGALATNSCPTGTVTSASSFATISSPTALAFDPYQRWIYVANASQIAAYDECGNVQTLSPGFSGLSSPTSITVVQ